MTTPWFHQIPNLKDHRSEFQKFGPLILELIVLRDDLIKGRKTKVSLKEVGQKFNNPNGKNKNGEDKGINEKTVKRILKEVLGITFAGKGQQGKTVVDENGWYIGRYKDMPNPPKTRKEYAKSTLRTKANKGFKADKGREDSAIITPFVREDDLIHTERFKNKEQKTDSPPTPSKEIPDGV